MYSLLGWVPRRYRPIGRERWDDEYTRGAWDYLDSPAELARYAIIVGYFRSIGRARPAVLDLGCGEGILERHLRPFYSSYVGVDVSDAAIRRASTAGPAPPATTFITADAQSYVPARSFDVIIFNELLYYVREPVALVRRYRTHLNVPGTMIISNVISRRSLLARRALRAAYPAFDPVCVRSGDVRWEIGRLTSSADGRERSDRQFRA